MFNKILIANRGEIALRIIRACKEMGIKTVAVHSEADVDSLHVRFADETVCIGPASSLTSYLNIPSVISAAEVTDAEAIHPGYGFLSENAHFAEVCESCKIKFIGPSASTIKSMGNKIIARETMAAAGVPLLKGTGKLDTVEEAMAAAEEVGYPLIIKSAGGGGGKGMRVVHTSVSLTNSFLAAQAEAGQTSGDFRVYLEKYIEEPKHIEFQVLADNYGNCVHLGERDCSVQRRFQKLIEESPCVSLPDDIRKKMGEAAITAVHAAGYCNAGTVEFLYDGKETFNFIEMNTRIQVEHPVTEMVTGVDLIKEQIRVAAGEPLSFSQKDVKITGHSIECRINAEDPVNFLPSPGGISAYHIPGGPGIRVDTAAYTNCVISPYYDSMIAKLIVKGENRLDAISKMRRALEEFTVQGVKTTIPFHKRVFENEAFTKGDFSTNFISKYMSD